MFKALKTRLILSFIVISFIGLIIVFLNENYDSRKTKINLVTAQLNKTQITHLNDQKTFRDFLYIDTRNSNFHLTKKSKFLNKHDSLFKESTLLINQLLKEKESKTLKIDKQLKSLKNSLDTFDVLTKEIVKYYLLKGFKDYGNTGEMRIHAHNLEHIDDFPKEYILMLRRHEKDFIIRGEKKYSDLYFEKYKRYKKFVEQLKSPNKEKILTELDAYKNSFEKLIMYNNIIGDKNNTGLYKKLNLITQTLQDEFINTVKSADKIKQDIFFTNRIIYIIILILLITSGIIAGSVIAKKITQPISTLSAKINLFVKSDFDKIENFKYKTTIPEIKKLIKNYFILKKKIIDLIHNFKIKVAERTAEIEEQKEQILAQNKLLAKQKKEVEEINQNIFAGLNYAKYIQNAMLPDFNYIKTHFPDSFILNKAKEIVSGDFYWMNRFINVESEDLSVFVVADATGHGVSGALMSMLGITFLDDITPRNDIKHASEVLMVLRDTLNKTLHNKKNKNNSQNGMDLGIMVFNNDTLKLEFSGANSRLWIVRDSEIIELKGDNLPIGGFESDKAYNDYDIYLRKNDCVYLSTDGYKDQFGGKNKQKFSKKRFKDLLISIAGLSAEKQKEILIKTHEEWKRNIDQTDDILIFGFKVS